MSVTAATISALAAALLFGLSAVSERTGTKKVKRSQVLSIVTTVNPVVAVALGAGLLDEEIRHSPLAITGEAASPVLAIVGIVVIACHSPQHKQKAEAGNVRAGY